jgi:hypothetical protein
MKTTILLGLLLTYGATVTATGADNPGLRLRNARSLRCMYTSSVATWVRGGERSVEQTNDKGTATYDNIDVTKGTARIIGNIGAGDIRVWLDAQGDLWMLEKTPSGNAFVTTVFPMYAPRTSDFIVLEARHSLSISGTSALGEESFGTCAILE